MLQPSAEFELAHKRSPALIAAGAIAILGALTLAGAYVSQYGFNYLPCPLCLEQRIAYYIAVPLAALVALGAWQGAPRAIVLLGLFGLMALMFWTAGLGVYHAGIEWKLWTGPQDCSAPLANLGAANDLLGKLQSINVVRCDEAPFRILGLSLAGWNGVVALTLAATALWGAIATARAPYGSSSVSQ